MFAKSSAYCFYVKTKIWQHFHICISVPLKRKESQREKNSNKTLLFQEFSQGMLKRMAMTYLMRLNTLRRITLEALVWYLATIMDKIFETNSSFHVKQRTTGNRSFFASIHKICILGVWLKYLENIFIQYYLNFDNLISS